MYTHSSKNPLSQSNAPIPPLPHWTFILALIATISIFLITDQRSKQSTEALVSTQDRLIQVKNIEHALRYYDEVLTMSALMYSYSLNQAWHTRYLKYEQLINADMNQLILLQPSQNQAHLLKLNQYNQELFMFEKEALTLIKHKKPSEAHQILEGENYLKAKQAFNDQLNFILSMSKSGLEKSFEDQKKLSNLSRSFILSMVGLIILIWFWLRNSIYSWQKHSQNIHTELQQTQLKLQQALNLAKIGSASINLQSQTCQISPSFAQICGLSPSENITQIKQLLALLSDDQQKEIYEKFLSEKNDVFDVILYLGKELKFIRLMLYTFKGKLCESDLLEVVILDITAQKEKEDKITSKMLSFSDLAQNRLETVKKITGDLILSEQREREKISLILHDELQPLILSARMQLSLLSKKAKEHTKDQQIEHMVELNEISSLLENALQISRLVMVDLSPPCLIDRNLKQSLFWLSNWFKNTHRFKVHLDFPSLEIDQTQLPQDEFLFVFSSAKEFLFNAFKHSKQSEGYLELTIQNQYLKLKIWDFGIGHIGVQPIQNDEQTPDVHYGLKQIQYRCQFFGGNLSFFKPQAIGFGVEMVIPIENQFRRDSLTNLPIFSKSEDDQANSNINSNSNISSFKTLLLVEDNHTLAMDFKSLLKQSHLKDICQLIGTAHNGHQAVEFTKSLNPDLVIMDISLPGISGLEATKRILQIHPKQKIIIFSMHHKEDLGEQAIELENISYVQKGNDSQILLTEIQKSLHLSERDLKQDLFE
jgi:signal transduction histidine kinase/AmiR/NasT family two-component response regulator